MLEKVIRKLKNVIRKFSKIYRIVNWKILEKVTTFTTISNSQGIYKVSTKDKIIAKKMYIDNGYEYEHFNDVIKYMKESNLIKNSDLLLDIGANIGFISIQALREKQFKKALAIEPEPMNFSLLTDNIEKNNLYGKIIPKNYALSNDDGELLFELDDKNFGDHRVRNTDAHENIFDLKNEKQRKTIKVKSKNILTVLEEEKISINEIGLIWIDVQGYEPIVMETLKEIIDKNVPVASEFWPYGMLKLGITKENLIKSYKLLFTHFYVLRKSGYVKYPISHLSYLYDELGLGYPYENIILVKEEIV